MYVSGYSKYGQNLCEWMQESADEGAATGSEEFEETFKSAYSSEKFEEVLDLFISKLDSVYEKSENDQGAWIDPNTQSLRSLIEIRCNCSLESRRCALFTHLVCLIYTSPTTCRFRRRDKHNVSFGPAN